MHNLRKFVPYGCSLLSRGQMYFIHHVNFFSDMMSYFVRKNTESKVFALLRSFCYFFTSLSIHGISRPKCKVASNLFLTCKTRFKSICRIFVFKFCKNHDDISSVYKNNTKVTLACTPKSGAQFWLIWYVSMSRVGQNWRKVYDVCRVRSC